MDTVEGGVEGGMVEGDLGAIEDHGALGEEGKR